MGADDVDLTDFRVIAFVHIECDVDAVALQRRHHGFHRHAVLPGRDIFALELVLGLFQRRTVENAPLHQTHIFQVVAQLVLGEALHAIDLDARHGRPFAHQHHQHPLLHFQPHILEKAGGIQRMQCLVRLVVVHRVADLDRQIAEHGAGLGTLDALHANILDGERFDSCSSPCIQQWNQHCQCF